MQQRNDNNCNRWPNPRQQIPGSINQYQTADSYLSSRPWNACQQQHYINNLSYPIPYSQRLLSPACREQQLDNSRFSHSPSSRRPLPLPSSSFYHHHHHGCCGYRMTSGNNAGIITGAFHQSASGSLDTFLKPRPPHSRDIVVITL